MLKQMKTQRQGLAPNYLHEGTETELTERIIKYFVAVATERNPVKRFALQVKRDSLRLELLRIRHDAATAMRHANN